MVENILTERKAAHNSTYPKGGVSCSKESFVVNATLVFQIKFCGKNPALWVAAKRYMQAYRPDTFELKTNICSNKFCKFANRHLIKYE